MGVRGLLGVGAAIYVDGGFWTPSIWLGVLAYANVIGRCTRHRSVRKMMKTTSRANKPLVLLFFDGYERKALEGVIGGIYSQARRFARWAYRHARRRQVRTGFYTAFLALERCLRQSGCDVRINDFAAARRNPNHPIGVAGYPSVLDRVSHLPNPRIFGPGDYGDPEAAVSVAADPRWKIFIQPCDWYVEFYRQACGDKMMRWFAGIDSAALPDARHHPKSLDVLVYDKLRWDRETLVPNFLEPLIRSLEARGLSTRVLRYGHHRFVDFAEDLKRARAMLFICEHETQGLAYQEAMAMNVPILAWDEGQLVDPFQKKLAPEGLKVSSVPYFDESCGMRFKAAEFESVFDTFWAARESFEPRAYVQNALSMTTAADRYLAAYQSLIRRP